MKMSFFRQHAGGLLVSLFISLVIALPPVWFHFSANYKGVDMLKTNTEYHYVAQIQEVFDGHHLLGNDNYADLKNQPYLFPILSPNSVWLLGKILSLSAIPTVMLVRFLSSFGLAFILYLLVLRVTDNKIAALTAAPFVMLAYGLVDPSNMLSFFKTGVLPSEKVFLHYARPINPEISSLFFFGYLLSLLRSLYIQKYSKWFGALSALLLGLSFYVYLFIWTFVYVFNGVSVVWFAYRRDWEKVKKIIAISFAALIPSVFYWINYFSATHSPWYAETATRFGFVKNHSFNISRLVISAIVIFVASYRVVTQRARDFFVPFFVTALFVVNEQVITGYYIFNDHFHWNYTTPLVIICLIVILFSWLQKFAIKKSYVCSVAALLMVVFFFTGINEQVVSYTTNLPSTIAEQRYAPVFEWLNTKTKKDETALASFSITDAIPAFTHSNVYYNGTGLYTILPTTRLEQNYLVYRYLERIPTSTFHVYLEDHRADISYFLFGYTYRFQENTCLTCFPDSYIEDLTAQYQTLNDANFINYLRQYPLEYIIWDKKNDPSWAMDRFKLPVVKEFGDIVVFGMPSP